MVILLSGFIGALFATVINIFYQYVSQQIKLRYDVLLEVVAYCDDIYNKLQFLHAIKNGLYSGILKELPEDEYKATNRDLTALLKLSRPGIKLAHIYGEGDIIGMFNQLREWFNKIATIMRKATPENWKEDNKKIMSRFSEEIDPLRASFENMLLQQSRATAIIIKVVNKYLSWFKICSKKNH